MSAEMALVSTCLLPFDLLYIWLMSSRELVNAERGSEEVLFFVLHLCPFIQIGRDVLGTNLFENEIEKACSKIHFYTLLKALGISKATAYNKKLPNDLCF